MRLRRRTVHRREVCSAVTVVIVNNRRYEIEGTHGTAGMEPEGSMCRARLFRFGCSCGRGAER